MGCSKESACPRIGPKFGRDISVAPATKEIHSSRYLLREIPAPATDTLGRHRGTAERGDSIVADFFWTNLDDSGSDERLKRLYDTEVKPTKGFTIHSNAQTTNSVTRDRDFVFVLGHCYRPGKTTNQTLRDLLPISSATDIAEAKAGLFGHFVAIIKRGDTVTIFGDYLQMRAIFYSTGGTVISSSLAAVERFVGAPADELDEYKVYELFAMRHVLYPGLLGNTTIHKKIHRLRPYEYIRINSREDTFEVYSCEFTINNQKISDVDTVARKLVEKLEMAIHLPELRESPVGATITGGYDSRLVAAIAARYFAKLRLRVCVSDEDQRSQYDSKVATKLAEGLVLPLDRYETIWAEDLDDYFDLTEGCSPVGNAVMARLLRNTHRYAIGFEGTLGTELFMPVEFTGVDDFLDRATQRVRVAISDGEEYLQRFRENLCSELSDLQNHYSLAQEHPQDWIRLLFLYNTVSSFSCVRSAYNVLGMQMEPYSTQPVIETAFQVPASMWGNEHTLAGRAFVQKKAMAMINYRLGKIMTFTHFSPMVPFSIKTLPAYAIGYLQHVAFWMRERASERARAPYVVSLGGFRYPSNGWNALYTRRILAGYQVDMSTRG
jgi:hypothetical protein